MPRRPSRPRPSPASPAGHADRNQTFTLRIVPERAPDVFRTVEMSAEDTLEDLHYLIQEQLDLDNDHLHAFYLSGERYDKSSEYIPNPILRRERSTSAKLRNLGLTPGRTFGYLFDFGASLWHLITVEAVGTREAGVTYPRLVASEGKAPLQYPDRLSLDEDLEPFVDEVARALSHRRIDHEDGWDDEDDAPSPPAAQLDEERALALRLLAAIGDRAEQLEALSDAADGSVEVWLDEVGDDLVSAGRHDEALELLDRRIDAKINIPWASAQRVLLLARMGRRDEALAAADEVCARVAEHEDSLDPVAEAWVLLGETARAEATYRKMIAFWSEPDPEFADEIRGSLAKLLRDQGRIEEAAAIEEQMEDLEGLEYDPDDDEEPLRAADDDWTPRLPGDPPPPPPPARDAVAPTSTAWDSRRAGSLVREEPKVGRNDPCPCGSGKKYKKCHGA